MSQGDKVMKIAILGCGAIGSLYAAHLAQSGHDILCTVKSGTHASQINDTGIQIINTDGSEYLNAFPKACTATNGEQPADIVLISVKSYATQDAVAEHSELFGNRTIALTLQNGYGNHSAILNAVPPERIVMGTTAMGVNIASDGKIILAGKGKTIIGSLAPDTPSGSDSLELIMKVLSDAGIDTEKTDDAEDAVLHKLLINVGINAVTSLHDTENRFICENADMREHSCQLVYEAADIINRSLGRNYDARSIWENVLSVAEKTGHNVCSMLQDIRKKRPTEINAINGAIADLARSAGLSAPVNEKITKDILELSSK